MGGRGRGRPCNSRQRIERGMSQGPQDKVGLRILGPEKESLALRSVAHPSFVSTEQWGSSPQPQPAEFSPERAVQRGQTPA